MMSDKKEGVDPGSGKAQCISVGEYLNREVGKVRWGTGGGKRACGTFGGQETRKGEMKWKYKIYPIKITLKNILD